MINVIGHLLIPLYKNTTNQTNHIYHASIKMLNIQNANWAWTTTLSIWFAFLYRMLKFKGKQPCYVMLCVFSANFSYLFPNKFKDFFSTLIRHLPF